MNLDDLKLFTTIFQAGSLSTASVRLNIAIATLSRRLSELEKSLQTQLFIRGKNGLTPTAKGIYLYEQVHLSIDHLLETERQLRHQQMPLSGVLRLSTPSACEPIWTWANTFRQCHPEVMIYIQVTDRVIDLIADGIDIAFRMGNLQTENVIARKVMEIHTQRIAHENVIAQWGTPKNPQDLIHFPCAGWSTDGQNKMQWQFSNQSIELKGIFTSNDIYAIAHFAKQGTAICQLPDYLAKPLIENEGFVEILPDHGSKTYPIHALYLAHRYPSTLIKKFLDFCLEQAA